jgi:hypothetical protein
MEYVLLVNVYKIVNNRVGRQLAHTKRSSLLGTRFFDMDFNRFGFDVIFRSHLRSTITERRNNTVYCNGIGRVQKLLPAMVESSCYHAFLLIARVLLMLVIEHDLD